MTLQVVDGLSPEQILLTAVSALRRHHGDRAAAAAGLRLIAGTPYRGTYAQLSDELIPSFYHQAADVLEFRQRVPAAVRWPR